MISRSDQGAALPPEEIRGLGLLGPTCRWPPWTLDGGGSRPGHVGRSRPAMAAGADGLEPSPADKPGPPAMFALGEAPRISESIHLPGSTCPPRGSGGAGELDTGCDLIGVFE
jgi:hypothetical protein